MRLSYCKVKCQIFLYNQQNSYISTCLSNNIFCNRSKSFSGISGIFLSAAHQIIKLMVLYLLSILTLGLFGRTFNRVNYKWYFCFCICCCLSKVHYSLMMIAISYVILFRCRCSLTDPSCCLPSFTCWTKKLSFSFGVTKLPGFFILICFSAIYLFQFSFNWLQYLFHLLDL